MIYVKELAHEIVETRKFKICGVGMQAGDPGIYVLVWFFSHEAFGILA